MSDTDGTAPDALPYLPRTSPGRRDEDIEIRRLVRNRLARRIAGWFLSALGIVGAFLLGGVREEWNRIPSPAWTMQVNEAVANTNATRGKLNELNIRVDNLQAAVQANSLEDKERQREVLEEIRGLRTDVKQAAKEATTAAAAATAAAVATRQAHPR